MITEALIGSGDGAVKRYVGQKVWASKDGTALGLNALTIKEFRKEAAGMCAIVEFVNDDFELLEKKVLCSFLSIEDPEIRTGGNADGR